MEEVAGRSIKTGRAVRSGTGLLIAPPAPERYYLFSGQIWPLISPTLLLKLTNCASDTRFESNVTGTPAAVNVVSLTS